MKTKKRYKKFLKVTVLALCSAIFTIAFIVLFPQHLFANKVEYKQFTVCSNDKIDDEIKIILDNAMSLVRNSELYDPGYKYNLIVCHNTFYNKIDNKIFGEGPAARARLNNLIIKIRVDPKNNLAFPAFRKSCEVNLTYLLAHEMIHCLQANKYGIKKFNPFRHPEFWKLEGYPEYISRKPERSNDNYSLIKEIDRYIELKSKAADIWISAEKGGCESPDYYFRGRLMIEYLMDVKHQSYDQILKDTISENTIYEEMIKWKDGSATPLAFKVSGQETSSYASYPTICYNTHRTCRL